MIEKDYIFPVYTKRNKCADCYRCVRSCPVKSIRIVDDAAQVIGEKCISCGKCVIVCPTNAMTIRNDTGEVVKLIRSKKVYVSLAPSWVAFFSKITRSQMIYALKLLGFYDVSETALGAEAVSQTIAKSINNENDGQKLYISSCCPSVVHYIKDYMPEYSEYITKLGSPALTHAKMLRNIYGNDIGVVFIGPCISKKNESDANKNLIDYALTFENLVEMLKEIRVDLRNFSKDVPDSNFVPNNSNEGTLYAIEGGMNKTLKCSNISKDVRMLSVSGISKLKNTLKGVNAKSLDKPIFLEALSCDNGCVNGPAYVRNPGIESSVSVMEYANIREVETREPKVQVYVDYTSNKMHQRVPSTKDITNAMASIGKYSIEDELNCAGCGYNSCYEFSIALTEGYAETSMCVSYMKKKATEKANAVLRSMPSGVVIIDANLKIVEVNKPFHNMFKHLLSKSLEDDEEAMIGFNVTKFLPCKDLFLGAIKSKADVVKDRYPIANNFYSLTMFSMDRLLGVIAANVTDNTIKEEEISKKAKEVIKKNIATVQEIASLLGEHVADTEVILSSIIPRYREDRSDEK